MAATREQLAAIDDARKAAESCRQRAEQCGNLGLTVLAREYDYFAKSFLERVEWQRRAVADPVVDPPESGGSRGRSETTPTKLPIDRPQQPTLLHGE